MGLLTLSGNVYTPNKPRYRLRKQGRLQPTTWPPALPTDRWLFHMKRAQRWREEVYKLSGYPLPEREWVGLTKNEVETLSYIAEGNTWIAIELAEVKLKEKNT